MRIIKIEKCSDCPWCEKLFSGKIYSPLICTYFEPDRLIEDKDKILEICELQFD